MSEKDIDLAIAGYNDCRSEIRDRVGLRDQWIARYVFGVVAFLGASLGIEKLDPDSRILLCLVMPALSLIVAINVSEHVRRIENLANFVRGPLNDFFVGRNAWAPLWDWQTSVERAKEKPEERWQSRRRRMTHILSLHLPSAVSLGVAAVLLGQRYQFCACRSVPPTPLLFGIAVIIVLLAVATTWRSFSDRLASKAAAQTPPGYDLVGGKLIFASALTAAAVQAKPVKEPEAAAANQDTTGKAPQLAKEAEPAKPKQPGTRLRKSAPPRP